MKISKLRREAESGNVAVQAILGCCYLDGSGVDINYTEAFRLLLAAANHGVSRAMVNLARMYAEGLGTPKNLPEAIRLYEAGAKAGEFLAQVELARIYSRGMGVPSDPIVARNWYLAATRQEGRIGDCDEIREAKAYVAGTGS